MRHFGRSRFEYFGPVSLSRKPKLCGACLWGSVVTYDAGPLIRIKIPAPATDQIARGRPGWRHFPFAPAPRKIIEHRGDELLSAGVCAAREPAKRLSRYRAFWAASHQFVDGAASR